MSSWQKRWSPPRIPPPRGRRPPQPVHVWLTGRQARYAELRALKRKSPIAAMAVGAVGIRGEPERDDNEMTGGVTEGVIQVALGWTEFDISVDRFQNELDIGGRCEVKGANQEQQDWARCPVRSWEHPYPAPPWIYFVTFSGRSADGSIYATIRGRTRRDSPDFPLFHAVPPSSDDGAEGWWVEQWALEDPEDEIIAWKAAHPSGRQTSAEIDAWNAWADAHPIGGAT